MINDVEIEVGTLAAEVQLVATSDGLEILYCGEGILDLSRKDGWTKLSRLTQAGSYLAQSIEQLIELELIEFGGRNLNIKYADLSELGELSCDFIELMVQWAPFSISVQSSGIIGDPSFKLHYEFMLGRQHSFPKRVGPFLSRLDSIYRLSAQNYELVDAIDRFNSLPEQMRDKEQALLCIAKISELSGGHGLDDYLRSEGVIIPQKVKIEITSESPGSISLFPSFDGVPLEQMKRVFYQLSDIQSVYDIETAPGKRLRVVIPREIQNILSDIQRVRRIGGAERDRIVGDVLSCISDGFDRNLVDVVDFSSRVKGICAVPERAQLLINAESRGWAGVAESDDEEGKGSLSDAPLVVRVTTDEGQTDIPMTFRDFRNFARMTAEARALDSAQVDYDGRLILIDDSLEEQITELEKRLDVRKSRPLDIREEVRGCQVLDIHQNFEAMSYSEGDLETLQALRSEVEIPSSLIKAGETKDGRLQSFQLKKHQEEGIRWLQNLFRNRERRRGCLLADDMGLGKTLQVLTFLAWCIETGYRKGLGNDSGPYEPILIVAPIILLDNWKDEMERFFPSGIFEPICTLYDSALRQFSIDRTKKGRETKDGLQKLDIDRIREHRVVISNYDTIKNYQHSLARIPWSVIVTDEAQEFKIQNQKSDALKALKAHFKIVATGTPVENRLLDLWNLVDFMHPGSLLGSAREFFEKYEKDIGSQGPEERKKLTQDLRKSLYYDRPDAFVRRIQV